MHVLWCNNVNEAYHYGVGTLIRHSPARESRAGTVLEYLCPVTTVYRYPGERVLLDPGRRANPFFHLFESLWMLAGRNDADWLDQFVSDFSSRFAEPYSGGVQHGAYGHRWRHNWDDDQLDAVVARLRKNRDDRRVVLTMWDPTQDLINPDDPEDPDDIIEEPRDLPCNTHIYPRISQDGSLDLTVCCRSNDIVWGAYGANAVHFSVLQEYLAGRLGVPMGRMFQISNSWHAYTRVLETLPPPIPVGVYPGRLPIGNVWDRWDQDLLHMMDSWDAFRRGDSVGGFHNHWFSDVAQPMARTHHLWREGDRVAAERCAKNRVHSPDWREGALVWMRGAKK